MLHMPGVFFGKKLFTYLQENFNSRENNTNEILITCTFSRGHQNYDNFVVFYVTRSMKLVLNPHSLMNTAIIILMTNVLS